MNILRLSTLSLTLAVAVFALGYNTSFADKPDPITGHGPHDDDPSAIDYSVELTAGAFVFGTTHDNSVDVTANKKGTELRSADPVTLIRPTDSTLEGIWNNVFEQCPDFFGPTPVDVPSFEAPSDGKGWTINKEGGIGVAFRKIPFTIPMIGPVEVTLHLHGTTAYEDPFLPDDPAGGQTTITHELSLFKIWGQTAKGGTPGLKCGGDTRGGDLGPNSILTITVKE